MNLQKTEHPYYCEAYECGCNTTEYSSWLDFKNDGDADMDYNLLFRFDIKKNDDEYFLELHHALQRHGYKLWHAVIHNIKEEDMPSIEKYLKTHFNYLLRHWTEVKE